MAIGNTNASIVGGNGKFKWVLEETFNPEETYYERSIEAINPSTLTGTYIFIDKTNIASARTSSYGTIYGNYSEGSASGTLCFRLEQQEDTGGGVAGPYWPCYGIKVKNNTNWLYVYFRMDSGNTNIGQCLDTYYSMPDIFANSYEGIYNRSLISIYDSSVIGSLMTLLNLCAVKVSDKIMGVDYNTRAELLQMEGYSSITDWVEALSTYTKVNLTSSTFVAYKYFKKVLLED